MYPAVMQLFWQRLKPAVKTERFLQNAIAIGDRVYRDIDTWYQPIYQHDIDEAQRHRIGRELDAFTFGNPQLLIQQVVLNRALQRHVVGRDDSADLRHAVSPYRHLEIPMLDEQVAAGAKRSFGSTNSFEKKWTARGRCRCNPFAGI